LLEAKLDLNILYELSPKATEEAANLTEDYENLRRMTYEHIENNDDCSDAGAKNKDRVDQSFLVAERAFLLKEIYDKMLIEMFGRENTVVMKQNNITEFGDHVIK